jgi:hypothetical protein
MMRALVLTAGLVVTALGAAPAAHGGELERPDVVTTAEVSSSSTSFHVHGPGGETVSVTAGHAQLDLAVELGRTSVDYFVKAEVTPNRIRADVGRFGRVNVTFDPHGRERFRPVGHGCSGGTRIQRGTFTGAIQFAGDAGYPALSAGSANGSIVRTRIRCRSEGNGTIHIPDDPGRRAGSGTVLIADDGGPGAVPGTLFAAIQLDGKRHTDFWAYTIGGENHVGIMRSAHARAPSNRFGFDPRHRHATVVPPRPFTGTASYVRSGDERTWTGDLALNLPGQSPIALTGAQFNADLGPTLIIVAIRSARAAFAQLAR